MIRHKGEEEKRKAEEGAWQEAGCMAEEEAKRMAEEEKEHMAEEEAKRMAEEEKKHKAAEEEEKHKDAEEAECNAAEEAECKAAVAKLEKKKTPFSFRETTPEQFGDYLPPGIEIKSSNELKRKPTQMPFQLSRMPFQVSEMLSALESIRTRIKRVVPGGEAYKSLYARENAWEGMQQFMQNIKNNVGLLKIHWLNSEVKSLQNAMEQARKCGDTNLVFDTEFTLCTLQHVYRQAYGIHNRQA